VVILVAAGGAYSSSVKPIQASSWSLGLAAQRLGGGAGVQLGCVDPLEAQPHAAVGGRVEAVGVLELGVGVGVVGDEADRVAVGLLADDHQPAVDGQVVGCRHDASSSSRSCRDLRRCSTP